MLWKVGKTALWLGEHEKLKIQKLAIFTEIGRFSERLCPAEAFPER
jgi:hypothetical protein